MSLFGIRWLWQPWLERRVPTLCQNAQGSTLEGGQACPLISIVNTLLLRGSMSLPASAVDYISSEELILVLSAYLVAANAKTGSEDRRMALHEALAMLPRLERGLDVDVRFRDCEGFQFTAALTAFDAVGIRLVHGWVVAPEEPEAQLLRDCTYDTIMLAVAAAASSVESSEKGAPGVAPPSTSTTGVAPSTEGGRGVAETVPSDIATGEAASEPPQAAVAEAEGTGLEAETLQAGVFVPAPAGAALVASTAEAAVQGAASDAAVASAGAVLHGAAVGAAAAGAAEVEAARAGPTAARLSTPASSTMDTSTVATGSDASDLARQASLEGSLDREGGARSGAGVAARPQSTCSAHELILAWLSDTASQLTHAGLVQLRDRLREGEFAVLFRNGHFSTLCRAGHDVFALITDVGYRDGGGKAAWELFSSPHDTVLCDVSFRPLEGMSSSDPELDSDFALAVRLQKEEEAAAQQQQGRPQQEIWQQSPAAAGVQQPLPASVHRQPPPAVLHQQPHSLAPPRQPAPPPSAPVVGRHDRYKNQAAGLRDLARERESRGPQGQAPPEERQRHPPRGKGNGKGSEGCSCM